MNYFDSYGQYENYQPNKRRNSGNFSDSQSGARRQQPRFPRKNRGGVRNVETNAAVFKEPRAPPRRSPVQDRRGSREAILRNDNYQRAGSSSQEYFDHRDMSRFIDPEHIGPQWNWKTYFNNCKSWQDKHKLAYYKSRCLALEFENQMLFQQISSLIEENCIFAAERGEMPTMRIPELNHMVAKEGDTQGVSANDLETKKRPQEGKDKESSEISSDFNFEICEDYLRCMEMRMRHKILLRKERKDEAKKKKVEEDLEKEEEKKKEEGPKKPVGVQRQESLQKLYGKDSAMIHKLETLVQLNFNRNCDTYKPEVWMAVPLNSNCLTV